MLNYLDMSDTLINIDALSELAHLEIPSSRKEKLAEDIGEILKYVERLRALDVGGERDPRDIRFVSDLREDVVGSRTRDERDGVVRNFPGVSKDGLPQVHAALEGSDATL